MQNAWTSIDDVVQWMIDHESYIWVIYSADRKTILSRNESTTDQTKSTQWMKRELEKRSLYGGTYAVYINDKKGNGGEWSDVVIAPQLNGGQVAGINGTGLQSSMPYGVKGIEDYIEKEFERRELKKRVEELEAGVGQSEKFWQQQVNKLTEHPDFNPNTPILAIGGLASRVVNILEIAMGVNGSEMKPLVPSQYHHAAQAKQETAINGVATEGGQNAPDASANGGENEEVTYDGDALAEVCDEIGEIYPDKKPEEVLIILKNLLKKDPTIAATVRGMAKF